MNDSPMVSTKAVELSSVLLVTDTERPSCGLASGPGRYSGAITRSYFVSRSEMWEVALGGGLAYEKEE